jgi:beta-glucosidase/6-phospho-beta-glucosidase/beta-galactosidase
MTLEGYAVEGGFDQPGAPATCYVPTIALGRHDGPGNADGVWSRYETLLDAAAALGLDGVRLNLEWARVEPRRGEFDGAALARYLDVVSHARSLGLSVTVALVDAAWPSWLGLEAWLLPWVEPVVVAHARRVAAAIDDASVRLVVFTDPQGLVSRGYLEATAPPWRRGAVREARFARDQLGRIAAALAGDDVVSPRLVDATTVSLDAGAAAIASARSASHVGEVHVRSLLAGYGPTRAQRGLVTRDGEGWRLDAPEGLLDALR